MTAARRRTWAVLLVSASCAPSAGDAWLKLARTVTYAVSAIAAPLWRPGRYPDHRVERGWRLDSYGAPVAELLAAKGFFVVGFDVKAYLERFTSGKTTLRPEDEPNDYKAIADFAARGATQKPILIGVSEGAGLSVLAASDPRMKTEVAGVIGLGMPELNELGWRWKDAIIYLSHRHRTNRHSVSRQLSTVWRQCRWARFTLPTTSSCRWLRSSVCWSARMNRRSSGSSTRRTIGSATT